MEENAPAPSKGYQKKIKTEPQSKPVVKKTPADYASPNAKKWPALIEALENGDIDKVKKFIEEGMNVNTTHNGVTPLMIAASKGHADIAEVIIQAGVNVNERSEDGWTALHKAAFDQKETAIIELLMESGIDAEARNRSDKTALNLAEEQGHRDIAKLIRKHQDKRHLDAQEWEAFLNSPEGKPYKQKRILESLTTYGKFMPLPPLVLGGVGFLLGSFLNAAVLAAIIGVVIGLLAAAAYYVFAWKTRTYVAEYEPIPHLDIYLLREKKNAGEQIALVKTKNRVTVEETSENPAADMMSEAIEYTAPGMQEDQGEAVEEPPYEAPPVVKKKKGIPPMALYGAYALGAMLVIGALIYFSGPLAKWCYAKKVERSGVPFSGAAFVDRVSKNNEEAVDLFIKAGIDPAAANDKGQTALMIAAEKGHMNILNKLIKLGPAAIDLADKTGNTALMIAARQGQEPAVRALVENGAAVNRMAAVSDGPATALQAAADAPTFTQEHANIIRYLLERGADVKVQNASGQAPLLFAARHGYTDAASVLLEKGAAVNETDKNGMFPLLSAACNGHSGLVTVLLDRGADLKTATADGQTPLICAVQEGHQDTVKILLDRGVSVNAKTKNGLSALTEAASRGNSALVHVLLEQGADPAHIYIPDSFTALNGKIATVKAAKSKMSDVMRQLSKTAAQDGYSITAGSSGEQKLTFRAKGPWNKVLLELAMRNHLFLVLKDKEVIVLSYDPAKVKHEAL